jgi:hypothetical protein
MALAINKSSVRRALVNLADTTGLRPAWQWAKAWINLAKILPRVHEQVRRGDPALILEYTLDLRPRWTSGHPNRFLDELIATGRVQYQSALRSFVEYRADYERIPMTASDAKTPSWTNGWIAPLDSSSLYGFLARQNPSQYIEVGSGTTTKFARRAIEDHGLRTRIVSIDPHPRHEIDLLCDEVVRRRLEDVDPKFWNRVDSETVLFVDGSHRCLTNSDVTVFFLDVLPGVAPGCLIGIHDIWLPYDYPEDFAVRLYSEQYMLGALLVGDAGRKLEIVLPTAYVAAVGDSEQYLKPLWEVLPEADPRNGALFWFRIGGNKSP